MNISKHAKLIENIKSIVLVVLILFTILLLCFFWEVPLFQRITGDDPPRRELMDPAEILRPDRINFCFGGDSYTVTETGFKTMMECFKTFSDSKTLSMEEIAKDRYEEVMRQPSIKAVFDYFVPFSAMCELYGIDRIPGSDAVEAMTEIGYAADFNDRMYVFDKNTDKYYRIVGSAGDCFDTLRNEISEAEKNNVTYFTLTNYVGGEVNNDALCPVYFESGIHDISYTPENFFAQAEKTSEIVRSFFSGNFDFVRRIEEESGTVIYMYGYGRVVVVARNDGTLEFRREDEERQAAQGGYLEAFERANAFIAVHGAFESLGGTPFTPYIKEVAVDPDGKRGFRFVFGAGTEDGRIYYQSGAPLAIDVTGGRVSFFRRDMINLDGNEKGSAESPGEASREVFSAINLLAGNYEYIRKALSEIGTTETEDISFEEIVGKVGRFDHGYVRLADGGGAAAGAENAGRLKAAWIVSIAGVEFYFGLDDGTPLGHSTI